MRDMKTERERENARDKVSVRRRRDRERGTDCGRERNYNGRSIQ